MTPKSAAEILQGYLDWLNGNKDAMPHDIDSIADALDLAVTMMTDPFINTDTEEPNWNTKPLWANYYAIDGDGSRWCYEFEPWQEGSNFNQDKGKYMNDEDSRRMKLFKRPDQ